MIFELPNDARVNSQELLEEVSAALGFEPEFKVLQEAHIETKILSPGSEELIVRGFQFDIAVDAKKDIAKVEAALSSHAPELTDGEKLRDDYLKIKSAQRAAEILAALDDPAVLAAVKAKLAGR